MNDATRILAELNDRSREVLRRVVEGYLESGGPVGSRTLTRALSEKISAATVRNVMQDLQFLGLLDSPHTSSGRVPTQLGLRMFVDGLLEVHDLDAGDRQMIEAKLETDGGDVDSILDQVGEALSLATNGASLVLSPKRETEIRHIEFVSLGHDRALAVLVMTDGHVENRLFTPPLGHTPSSMREAANFLNSFIEGKTLAEVRGMLQAQIRRHRQTMDSLAQELVESGLVIWDDQASEMPRLIVRGRANLLEDSADGETLERIRTLFDDLERKRDIVEFLELAEDGEGVRIFIGSENKLFSLSGSSLVMSPYMNADRKIIGAVGVIGPTRLNYGRIVPIVGFTAHVLGRAISEIG